MIIVVAFSIMLTCILAYASWNKTMSPYHVLAKFGFFISGLLCLGAIAESTNPAIIFLMILVSFGCFFMLYKMFTQV
jgi:hypothetical protein